MKESMVTKNEPDAEQLTAAGLSAGAPVGVAPADAELPPTLADGTDVAGPTRPVS